MLPAGKKRPLTCFNLNPDECVQHLYQSVIECSYSGKLFFSLIAGDIPKTTYQISVLFFFLTFIYIAKLYIIKGVFEFPCKQF